MQNDSIELEPIDSFINCIVQFLKLLFCQHEIISYHLFQVGLSGLICVHVFADDMPYIIDGVDIVDSLVLLMVLYATFCLTNCAGAGTCETRSYLNAFAIVEFTH